MNKQKGKNSIGWCDFTSNPIKGICPNNKCPVFHNCYARAFYKRLKWNPKIRLDEKELLAPSERFKRSGIFVGSTIELYHPRVPYEWISRIIAQSYAASWHTYYTLTKCPENLKSIEFPEWWWVGVSITGKESYIKQPKLAFDLLKAECSHRFISFEPLLGKIDPYVYANIATKQINWIIIGAQTNPYQPPKKEWVENILRVTKTYNIPIFLKDNLKPIMGGDLIQEFPERRKMKEKMMDKITLKEILEKIDKAYEDRLYGNTREKSWNEIVKDVEKDLKQLKERIGKMIEKALPEEDLLEREEWENDGILWTCDRILGNKHSSIPERQ